MEAMNIYKYVASGAASPRYPRRSELNMKALSQYIVMTDACEESVARRFAG